MKIPTPRKLPSGMWHIQLRINGKSISITDQDKKSCVAKAAAIKAGLVGVPASSLTLTQAIDNYIDRKSNTLSPSTIRGYRSIQKHRLQNLMNRPVSSITSQQFQKAINTELETKSAKTVHNVAGFINTVIKEETGSLLSISLPQVVKNEHPFLTPEQLPVFLDAIRGSDIEIPCLLGLWSLRSSEMYAITRDKLDFKRRLIFVEGSVVKGPDSKRIHKQTNKNSSSRRTIPMADRLYELLSVSSEPYVSVPERTLYTKITRVCEDNGLPKIGIHGLRHSFVSFGFMTGIPKDIIQEIGGWSNDATMERVYKHLSASYRLTHSNKMVENFNLLTKC